MEHSIRSRSRNASGPESALEPSKIFTNQRTWRRSWNALLGIGDGAGGKIISETESESGHKYFRKVLLKLMFESPPGSL